MKTAEMIKHEVEQELSREPSVCATKNGVSVNECIVELNGHVGNLFEKWAAERAALRVVNVTSVASEIIVDLPFESERTDEDIALAGANQLNWNSRFPDTIKLTVTKGWVTLQGSTEWQYQIEEAVRVLQSLRGVIAVSNENELRPIVSAMGVKSKIENALKRVAQIEAKDISVEATAA